MNRIDPRGLWDWYGGADIDIATSFGGAEFNSGFVVDFSDFGNSGVYGGYGPSVGGSVGSAVGAGVCIRDVEGMSENYDVNLPGGLSVTVSFDDVGFNGLFVSFGVGGGLSGSFSDNTSTITVGDLLD